MKFQIPLELDEQWQHYLKQNELHPAQALTPYIEDYLSGQLPMQRLPYPRLRRKGQKVAGRSITIDNETIYALREKIINDEVSQDAFFRSLISYIVQGPPCLN